MKNRNFLFWIDSKFRFFAPLTQYYSTFWEPKNINFDWIWNFLKIKNWKMVGISENLAAKLKSIKWFNFKCSPSCQKFQATPLNLWLSGRLSGWLNSIISFLYFHWINIIWKYPTISNTTYCLFSNKASSFNCFF